MLKNFYIFRHGESSYNVEDRIQGHSDDSVLTDEGRAQAHNTGEILKNKGIEIIISSPLKRAQETGNIVAQHTLTPIVIDPRFIEVNVGVIEGMLYQQVLEKFGELYQKWRTQGKHYGRTHFPGGETKKAVRERVFEALNHYAQKTPYKNIAISGHGIILIQALLALGINQQSIPNGAIIHLQYKQRHWSFIGFVNT